MDPNKLEPEVFPKRLPPAGFVPPPNGDEFVGAAPNRLLVAGCENGEEVVVDENVLPKAEPPKAGDCAV